MKDIEQKEREYGVIAQYHQRFYRKNFHQCGKSEKRWAAKSKKEKKVAMQ